MTKNQNKFVTTSKRKKEWKTTTTKKSIENQQQSKKKQLQIKMGVKFKTSKNKSKKSANQKYTKSDIRASK